MHCRVGTNASSAPLPTLIAFQKSETIISGGIPLSTDFRCQLGKWSSGMAKGAESLDAARRSINGTAKMGGKGS